MGSLKIQVSFTWNAETKFLLLHHHQSPSSLLFLKMYQTKSREEKIYSDYLFE